MKLDDWIKTTQGILSKQISAFLPVVADPATKQLRALDGFVGVPSTLGDPDTALIQGWITKLALSEYFFAVAESPSKIVVGHIKPNGASFAALDQAKDWKATPCAKPTWWSLS